MIKGGYMFDEKKIWKELKQFEMNESTYLCFEYTC